MRKVGVIVSINLVVAALHFVTGPDYRGPWRHFVTGYLIAITLPFAAYFLLAVNDETMRFLRPWFIKVGVVFAVISSAEVAQYLGKPIFGRTYDPWDFVAYAAGALLAAAADRLLFPRIFHFWTEAEAHY
jgi:hypothetical protein